MKLKSLERKSIAKVPADFSSQQRRFAESVAENLDVLTGRRGNLIDRAVTFRDLLDAGLLRRVTGLVTKGTTIDLTDPNDDGETELPNKPYNLVANGGFFAITLQWEMNRYKGHSHTEIWRAPPNQDGTAPTIDEVVQEYGPYDYYYGDINYFVDSNVGSNQTFYYWIRAVNKDGTEGAFNDSAGTSATTALDYIQVEEWIDQILDTDSGNLGLSDHIDSVVGVLGSNYDSYTGDNVIAFLNTFTEPNTNATTFAQALLDDVFPDGYSSGGGLVTSIYSNITTTDAQGNVTYVATAGNVSNLMTAVGLSGATSTKIDGIYSALDYDNQNGTFGLTATAFESLKTEVYGQSATVSRIDTLQSALEYTDVNGNTQTLDATYVQDLAIEVTGSNTGLGYSGATRIDGVEAILTDSNGSLFGSTVLSTTVAKVGDIEGDIYDSNGNLAVALSSTVSTLSTKVDDNEADIQTNLQSINGVEAKYSVKIDNNDHVSGFGLISYANEEDANNPVTSAFIVAADRFAIAAEFNEGSSGNSAVGTNYPFKVFTTSQTAPDGVSTIPAGAYIRDAFIYTGQITTAMINDATIAMARVTGNLAANRITSGEIVISSSNQIAIRQGKTAFSNTADGFWLGNNNGKGAFHLGNATNYIKFDGTNSFQITGAAINQATVDTLQLAGDAVTIPAGDDSGSISVNVGGSFITVSGYTYLNDWDADGVPSNILVSGNVQFVGTDTSGATSNPATAGVRFAWDWKNTSGGWTGGTNFNSTIGQTSLTTGFGGQPVSNAIIPVPSTSRGMRIVIQARNTNFGGSDSANRKCTGYGFFVVAAKR